MSRLSQGGNPSFSQSVRPILLRIAWTAAVAILFGGLYSYLTTQTEWIEQTYATHIYPALAQPLSALSSIFPFSFAELLAIAAVIVLPVTLVITIVRSIRHGAFWHRFLQWIANLLAIATVLWVLFSSWSLLYYRKTLGEQLGLPVTESSTQELVTLCETLIAQANELRAGLQEDENGNILFPESLAEMLSKVPSAYASFSEILPCVSGSLYCPPKGIMLSPLMNYTQIVGIYVPFTVEPNVNTAILPTTILANACHEAAHQRGYAREDEANYLAYRVCMVSEDPYFMYSGTYLALLHAMNALFDVDRGTYLQLRATYSRAVDHDFTQERLFWDQYEGPIAEATDTVNDRYLRANNQSDGVRSYGRMVDLLLAEMRK